MIMTLNPSTNADQLRLGLLTLKCLLQHNDKQSTTTSLTPLWTLYPIKKPLQIKPSMTQVGHYQQVLTLPNANTQLMVPA